MERPIRVLIAKPGLDGHDRGALVVAQGLRDHGMEVIYTGLRQTPEQIVAVAIQEDVACIGLSSLSGAHLALFPEVVRLLRAQGVDDMLILAGGVIPQSDVAELKRNGIAAVFGPGSSIADMANFIREHTGSELPVIGVDRIDHIGIAVANMADAIAVYEALGLQISHREQLPDQQVNVVFLRIGEVELELLEPTAPTSVIARYLERRGPGIHHVAYAVSDVSNALASAKARGWQLIDSQPRPGGRGKWIAFVHPKSTNGALTELCQRAPSEEIGDDAG